MVTNKLDELEASIDMNDPDIIVLTEVLPKNNRYTLQKSELETKGYTLFINNFETFGIRGVAIYIKKGITANQIHPTNCADDTAWVEIKMKNKEKLIIGGVYRSPNSSGQQNDKLWETLLNMSDTYKDNLLIMGDFNCGGINWIDVMTNEHNMDALNNKLIEVLRDCFLEQVITENTRARGTNVPSLIDLVLCNDRELINNINYLSPLGKSDHCIITFTYNVSYEKSAYKIRRIFYEKGDYASIRKYLNTVNWDEILSGKDTQQQYDTLIEIVKLCEEKYIPSKIVEKNNNVRFSEKLRTYIRVKIKKKHNLWKRYMETKKMDIYREYCRTRNKVKNMMKFVRKNKERDISFNATTNNKAFWKYINSKTKSTSGIASLHANHLDVNSILVDNNKEKANILNTYFASVYTEEPNGEIPTIPTRSLVNQEGVIITENAVKKLLSELDVNKSPGPDGIHPRFINELTEQLCLPLSIIFKESMKTSIIPKQWKLARVSAIHKKGSKKMASNYRPVSITSIVCRTMEKILRDNMASFLVENNLLSNYQFGFIKGRSTTLQLLNVLNDWTQTIESKNFTDCIYMDYQKAFDKVPHNRLISKLKAYKFNAELLDWVQSYLKDRSQFVEVNGKQSMWLPVTSGIPQGSVLGPLLFLLYINDLPDNIDSSVYMYADDTKLYREIREPRDHEILQEDLNKLSVWSDLWLLKFHPEKCFSLTIGKQDEGQFAYHMMIDKTKTFMTKVEDIKDIGVTIDCHLKFEKHINGKIVTANKLVRIIRRSFMFLNEEIFVPLYKSLVRSHFDYGMSVWTPHLVKYIKAIESVQRRATKMIPTIKDLSYSERLKKLKLPTLAYRRARGDMIEVYKIVTDIYDPKTTNNLFKIRGKQNMLLRGHQFTMEHERLYTSNRSNFFVNRIVNNWNSLPREVVGAGSLNAFKNLLDSLWSNQDLLYNDYRAVIEKKDYVLTGSKE